MVVAHFPARQGAAQPIYHFDNAGVSVRCNKETIIILIVLITADNAKIGIATAGELVSFNLDVCVLKLKAGCRDRSAALVVDGDQIAFAGISL